MDSIFTRCIEFTPLEQEKKISFAFPDFLIETKKLIFLCFPHFHSDGKWKELNEAISFLVFM